ncbi:hypothetical protein RJ641_023790 [Dillenia turbinata]|uniref:FACT complex subunit n=1 Tax=Dillenia turbinata TaxID=194707 RepID=A0AAN8UJX9_9MAGN
MKHFAVPKLEKIIDEEKKDSHSSLMEDRENAILEPARIKVKLKAKNVDICYPPIFLSGGKFDLSQAPQHNHCAFGSRNNSYCSNVARTFLIDANAVQSKAYERQHVVEKDAPTLTKSAGTRIGLKFRESGLSLNAKSDRILKAGMVVNILLGF